MATLLMAAGPLAGCTSTQQKAARLQLNDARLRAAQLSTQVAVASRTVAVTTLSVIREPGRTAFVATVANRGARAVSDLPISIAYRREPGRVVYLNGAAGAGYFDAHLPLIGPHQRLAWVYSTTRRLPTGARPFAIVGSSPTVRVTGLAAPPTIVARVTSASATDGLAVKVRNRSAITQYELPVYAVAKRGSKVLAAAGTTIAQLDGDASEALRLRLPVSDADDRVELEALPTIFR